MKMMMTMMMTMTMLTSFSAQASVFDECSFFDQACWQSYQGDTELFAAFDELQGENPESLAFDSQGNLFVSMALTGEILKRAPDGTETTFAQLNVGPFDLFSFTGFMGAIAIDLQDNLYVSLLSDQADERGVWKVTPDGTASLLASMPFDAAPNGVALLHNTLYIADSFGKVWTADKNVVAPAEVFSDDVLLAKIPNFPIPGPNGIQVYGNEVSTTISATGLVVAIDLGTGAARIHASHPQGGDDFAFAIDGTLYMTTDLHQTLLKVDFDGTVTEILSGADGLDGPTSVVFGRGSLEEAFRLYIGNAAFPFPVPPGFPAPPGNGASVLSVDLNKLGLPRHWLSY